MNELPLSKFAPFDKHEALFQWEVHNKLKELNVNCNNCIYLGENVDLNHEDPNNIKLNNKYYSCNILSKEDNLVQNYSFCKFFTAIEEIEDTNTKEDSKESSTEEMSVAIQKLDFTNSNISNIITDLKNKIINE